jgi:hypothetical protein
MALPTRTSGLPPTGVAVADLGLGDVLQEQVANESEEQRKKRLQLLQERSLMGPAGTPATLALFGGGLRGPGA